MKRHLFKSRITLEYLQKIMVKTFCIQVIVEKKENSTGILKTFYFCWGIFGIFHRFRSRRYMNVIQYYFWVEICKSFPVFAELRSGRITEAVSTLRGVRSQAELGVSVLIPLVLSSAIVPACCPISKSKKTAFTCPSGRGMAGQSLSGNEGRQKWRHSTLWYAVIRARGCSIKSLIRRAQVKKPA